MFLFWFGVLSLLSSCDEVDVCVELLLDDVWVAEEDKTGFLIIAVDIFYQLYLKERPISLHMVKMSIKKLLYDKWDYVRKLNKIEICEKFDE